jgi:hypothetical protein
MISKKKKRDILFLISSELLKNNTSSNFLKFTNKLLNRKWKDYEIFELPDFRAMGLIPRKG